MTGYKCAEASRERWIEAAKACPYATYFHTPYWYELIAPGGRHTALEVSFEDGVSAVIPVAEIKRAHGLLTDHFSSPGCNYGGWISASVLNKEHVMVLTNILMSKKNLTFRINPFDESQSSLLALTMPSALPPVALMSDFTHTLDLTAGTDALLRGMAKGHRSAVKSAEREGVVVKAADTVDEWERYYGIYLESVKRWRSGGPKLRPRHVYPPALFRRAREMRTGNEILWLAMKDGELAAGALFFYWGRHAVSWHGAASAEHFHLRPNNLLYWEIISDAVHRGYKVFDFNPSGGYGGVESFKSHFGAVRVPSPVLSTKTPLRSLISRLRPGASGCSSK
ncbi:MAG: GNAT family N-acetyltransferase [Chitinispirillia bacterium]|nr:GNAT family N-acetyltransferase [Chitinispirillia bacterium]MCL2240918.1 GNAT family N-acetyltransferase [Chitinispirillia bacterium]